jgi:hypothetical protein
MREESHGLVRRRDWDGCLLTLWNTHICFICLTWVRHWAKAQSYSSCEILIKYIKINATIADGILTFYLYFLKGMLRDLAKSSTTHLQVVVSAPNDGVSLLFIGYTSDLFQEAYVSLKLSLCYVYYILSCKL